MKWLGTFLIATLALCILQGAQAENVFFLDQTEHQVFAPLREFLENTLHQNVLPAPSGSAREDLPKVLAGERAYLVAGYDRGDLLFFEMWDLEKPRKVLGMVRRFEDAAVLLEDLKRWLPGVLAQTREWKLFFVRHEAGQSSIVSVDLRGKQEVVFLPPEGGEVQAITVTPDGQFLLAEVSFSDATGIFRMEFASRTWQRLSPPSFSDTSPAFFSPRRTILFLSERGGKRGIYEMRLDGSKQRLLLERENPIQKIAASPYVPLFAFSEFTGGRWVLTLFDLLRGREHSLDFPGNVFYPVFGGQEDLFFIGENQGRYDVYHVSLGDEKVTRLTFDGLPKADLAVSPGKGQLAFSVEFDRGNWDIVVFDPKRRTLERFTASWAKEMSPAFSPIPMY